MRQVDFQLGKPVEHAAENQRRRCDARIVWIPEEVAQVVLRCAFAAEGVDRMQKNRPFQLFRLGVDVPETAVIEVGAVDVRREIEPSYPGQARVTPGLLEL